MSQSISTFRDEFVGNRANRFKVVGSFPVITAYSGYEKTEMEFYCKAASMPSSTIGTVSVGHGGRAVRLPGDRSYSPWTIQVYESPYVQLRNLFEDWIEYMDTRKTHETNNVVNTDFFWEFHYQDQKSSGNTTPTVEVQRVTGNVTTTPAQYRKKIKFYDVFPIEISPIEFSYDNPDTFAEFTVTFNYLYWEYLR
jgi:hypothetical protein